MNRLKQFLFAKPALSLRRYILVACPLALLPSLALLFSVMSILTYWGVDVTQYLRRDRQMNVVDFFGAVVFSPVVETYLLALCIKGLLLLTEKRLLVASAASVFWGCLHGFMAPLWFFGTAWSFFVFACAYMVWRSESFRSAYLAAMVPHALINLTVSMILLFDW